MNRHLVVLQLIIPLILTFPKTQHTSKALLSNAQNPLYSDTAGVSALIAKGMATLSVSYDTSSFYLKKAIRISNKLGYTKGLAKSYCSEGELFKYYGMNDSAISSLNKCIKLNQELNNVTGEIAALNNLGYIYKTKADFQKSIEIFNRQLKLSIKTADKKNIARSHSNLGRVIYSLGDYEKATGHLFTALKIADEENDSLQMSFILNQLGNNFSAMKRKKQAFAFYLNAMEINKKINNQTRLASNFNNIGDIYFSCNNYDSALHYFNIALEIISKNEDKTLEAIFLNNIGDVYSMKKQFSKATDFYKRSKAIFEKTGDVKGISLTLREMSQMYLNMELYDVAMDKGLQALKIALEIEAKDYLIPNYKILAETSAGKHNYKDAYQYYILHKEVSDSVLNEKNNQYIQRLKIEYETEKKEQKINIQQLEIRNKSILIQFISTGIFLMVISLFIIYREFKKQKVLNMALFERNLELMKMEDIQSGDNNDNIVSRQSTGLKSEEKEKKIQEFEELLIQGKIYRQKELSLQDVATSLVINRVYLSKLINEKYQKHFNNLINEYRIKEARHLLVDPKYKDYTIEGIADLVGFNSKTTFNDSFKKITGLTPSDFKRLGGTNKEG